MNPVAFVLIVLSALLHAVWNMLLKRAGDRVAFVWWYLLVPLILFSPMAVLPLEANKAGLPPASLGCGLASGVLQAVCLLAVARAYQGGDLSVVYPLSRGVGHVLIVVLGVGLLRERLSFLGAVGLALVFFGVYVVFLPALSGAALLRPFVRLREASSMFALGAGLTIACYHVLDRVGMRAASPYQYILLLFATDFAAYTGFLAVRRRWDLVWAEWRRNRLPIAVAGSLSLVSYLLVLHALKMERVAYVGPARNLGIVFSVILGAALLKEKHGAIRVVGSALIVVGLALAGVAG